MKPQRSVAAWVRTVVVALVFLGIGPLRTEGQVPRPSAERIASVDAAQLYADACATCHGRNGDGNSESARLLGAPRPRDFTSGVFKFRSTPTGALPTDDDIFRTISLGVPGTWMSAWQTLLTPEQRWALVNYVKSFSDIFAMEDAEASVLLPPVPTTTPALIDEGRYIYLMLECAKCHGVRGRGDGPSAGELTDDWGQRIRPYDFTRGHYKNGSAASDVYRTLITGLDGTPMPAFDGPIIAFAGGRDADVPPYVEMLEPEDVGELRTYLANQPTESTVQAMSEDDAEDLVQRRRWALVFYLESLNRSPGLFRWLFAENPELPRRGSHDER